jgi:hypothetical protein
MSVLSTLVTFMALAVVSSSIISNTAGGFQNKHRQILRDLGWENPGEDGSKPRNLGESGFTEVELDGHLLGSEMQYRINWNDTRVGKDTITIAYRVPAIGWLAIGFSDSSGVMVGSEAVIGVPSTNQVLKYSLDAEVVSGIVPLQSQTLMDQSVVQDAAASTTTLVFTKIMAEDGEKQVIAGLNTFLGAYGSSNSLGLHTNQQAFNLDLGTGVIEYIEEDEHEEEDGGEHEEDEGGEHEEDEGGEDDEADGGEHDEEEGGEDDEDEGSEDDEDDGETTSSAATAVGQDGFTVVTLEAAHLKESSLLFKVNPSDPNAGGVDTVTFVYTAPQLGWVAIGFSDNGGVMVGSEAVIGLPDTGEVLKYDLNGEETGSVVPMSTAKQTLIAASIIQDATTTTLTFTKRMVEEGEVPIIVGLNTFLGAYGGSNTLGLHTNDGSFSLDLASGSAESIQNPTLGLWKAHGLCALVAWGFLSPCAIAASLLRPFFRGAVWFQVHRAFNILVVLLTVAAFGLAVAAINQETAQGESPDHFDGQDEPHRVIGLVIAIVAVVQALLGIFRPHVPEEGEEPTMKRKLWEVAHKVLGYSCLGMAIYQVQSGIKIYSDDFGEGEVWLPVFWALICGIGGGTAVGVITLKCTKKPATGTKPAPGEDDNDLPGQEQPETSK